MIINLLTTKLNNHCYSTPFLLKAIGIHKMWGGIKLSSLVDDDGNTDNLAEIWKCSTNIAGVSVINSGTFKGLSLIEVIKKAPEILGHSHLKKGDLPIIVKLIDACDRLSIQVHPSDEYAAKYEKGQLGKSEFLYILEAENGAYVYVGFNKSISKDRLREVIENGSIEKYLKKIPVKAGDGLYIPATIIHGIGSGVLALEVSQNSNITYRVYDFDRLEMSGKQRELHIDKAIDVMDISEICENRIMYNKRNYVDGGFEDTLCNCKYFNIKKVVLNKHSSIDRISMEINEESFRIILCIEGFGTITYQNNNYSLEKYDCFFIPAATQKITINGDLIFFIIKC